MSNEKKVKKQEEKLLLGLLCKEWPAQLLSPITSPQTTYTICPTSILLHFPMAKPISSPLHEKFPQKNTLHRALDLTIFFLLLSLLAYRLLSLKNNGFTWLLAFLCESWFTFIWILNVSTKWNPVSYKTYPERLLQCYRYPIMLLVKLFMCFGVFFCLQILYMTILMIF